MNTPFRSRLLAKLAAGALLAASAGASLAQAPAATYPARPVRLVVPFPAGGPADAVARLLAQQLNTAWAQQSVIDNRPGAGGNIGAEAVARATPDGHVLLFTTSSLSVAPALYRKLAFDPLRDFQPVGIVAIAPFLLSVHPSVPARTLKELLALAKSRPGQLNYASTGNGTIIHLSFELLKSMTGTDIVHVPYKGTAPAMIDVTGGHVSMILDSTVSSLPHVRAGRLRALGITGRARSAAAPEIPAIAEAGVPGYEAVSWYGLLAPAGLARDTVDLLHAQVAKTTASTEVRARLANLGAEPGSATPEEFAQLIRAEIAKWAKVASTANIRIE